MKKTVTKLTPQAKHRLEAIEFYQAGNSQRATAEKYGVHFTTIGEWVRLYQQGGIEALNAPLKPRQPRLLDLGALKTVKPTLKYKGRIAALIDLAKTKKLNQTAARHGITPQGLAKWRRDYLAGKWPK